MIIKSSMGLNDHVNRVELIAPRHLLFNLNSV